MIHIFVLEPQLKDTNGWSIRVVFSFEPRIHFN